VWAAGHAMDRLIAWTLCSILQSDHVPQFVLADSETSKGMLCQVLKHFTVMWCGTDICADLGCSSSYSIESRVFPGG